MTRWAVFIAFGVILLSVAAARAQSDDDVLPLLTKLAQAVNLSESGQHEQVVSKLTVLIADLEKPPIKTKAPPKDRLPVLRDTSCGDVYKQIRADALALKGLSHHALRQSAQAVSDLKKAVSICPGYSYGICDLGTVYANTKKTRDAVTTLSRAIKLNPVLREAYFVRASCYQQLGKRKDAQRDLSKAQALMAEQQKKIDSLTEQIDKLAKENKMAEAIALDKQLLRVAPRDSLAVTGYADHLSATGQNKEALKFATLAIALDPSNGYAFRIRSVIQSHLQRPDLELRDANKALSLEPRSLEALNSRAIANLEMDRPYQAIRDLDLIIKRKSDFADAYINRSTAYLRLSQFENAIKDAKMSVSLAPKSPYSYQALGAALRRAGKPGEARGALEQSLKYSKNAAKESVAITEFTLGAVLLAQNDSKGNEQIGKAIGLNPNLGDVFLQRGAYDATRGVADHAIKILTRRTTRGDTSKVSKLKTSKPAAKQPEKQVVTKAETKAIRISRADLEDCILVTSRIIAQTPGKSEPYLTRGFARMCLNQPAEATDDFKKYSTATKTARGQALAFLALERTGKQVEARKYLSTAGSGAAKDPVLGYLANQVSEKDLLAKSKSQLDQTRARCYAGVHLASLRDPRARDHLQWVLNNGDITSFEFVLAAAEYNRNIARENAARKHP